MTQTLSISDLGETVDAEMRDILDSRNMPFYDMMYYQLGWSEEPEPVTVRDRRRGVLCLLGAAAAGGDLETVVPAAAAVELVRNFLEIHDDVQSGTPSRDQRDTVWWVWGPAQAINAGDGMHALARLALFRLQGRGVDPAATFDGLRLLDQTALNMCEGRYLDLEALERIDLSVDAYLSMARAKTGSLFSCALKLGSMLSADNEALSAALEDCGLKMGVAAQVRADVSEMWPEDGTASPEVMNKKKMLPVVYAMEQASVGQKRRIGDIYFKRVLKPEDVADVREVLEELGSREYCETVVDRYREEALISLRSSGATEEGANAIETLFGTFF